MKLVKLKKRDIIKFSFKNLVIQFLIIDWKFSKDKYNKIIGTLISIELICIILGWFRFENKKYVDVYVLLYLFVFLLITIIYFVFLFRSNEKINLYRKENGEDPLIWDINKIIAVLMIISYFPMLILGYLVKRFLLKNGIMDLLDYIIPIFILIMFSLVIIYFSIIFVVPLLFNIFGKDFIHQNGGRIVFIWTLLSSYFIHICLKEGIRVWFYKVKNHDMGNLSHEKLLISIFIEIKYSEILIMIIGIFLVNMIDIQNEMYKILVNAYIFTSTMIAWIITLRSIYNNEIIRK